MTFNFQRLSKATVPTGDSILVNQIIDIYRRAINAINPDLTNLATADWTALIGDLKGFEGFLRQLFDPLKAAILQGAVKQEAPLSRTVNATMRFDITDPRAIAYAEDRVGQLIKQVTEEVQQTVRDVVARAFREGRTVDQIAAELRNSIGLHDRWARAVENFERRQFEQLSKTMPYETAMKKAAELAEKYRARLIRKRAMTIARTETGQAAMYGRYLSWLQAADSGLIDPYTTGKRWFATRPCDRCKLLNGETVGMLETFSNGKMGPLDHPNCKCTMVLIPNWKPSLNPVSVEKAYQRKYATRREAAQAAANARWGNRTPKPSASKEVNWTKLETIDEVNAAWNDKHGDLVPGGFEGVSIRFARQAAAGLDAMFEQYPDVAAGLSFVGGTSSPLYRPTVQKKLGLSDAETTKLLGYLPNGCFGGTSMKYGFIVFSEDSDNLVQDAFSKNQYSGWVVPTRSNVKAGEYIAVHEFGHAVARHMGKQSSSDVRWQNDLQSVLDKGNSAAWKSTRPLVTKINEFGRETTGSREISKALSEYGAADPDEAFAESWAEIHLSDSPRPYATTWVNGFAEGLGVPVPTSRVAKAYKRKFATREEAARFAANARWGGKKADVPASTRIAAAEWTDLPTTDAIEEEWQRRFPNIKVDLVGIKPDVANEAAAAFVENAALFPEVAERIGVIQGSYISAAMSARQPVWDPVTKKYRSGRIRISSLYTKEKFDDAVKRGQESGLFVAGSYDPSRIVNGRPMTGVRSVMTHEFGHHVDYWLGSMTDGRSPSPAGAKDHDKFMQSTKLKIKKEFQKTLVPGAKADVKFAIGKTISRYATTNNRELFAESFAEFYTSANPRPAARTIIESAFANMGVPVPSSIQKAYKRKYATRREAAQAAARARWGNRAPKVDAISPVYSADFEPWQNQKGNPEIAAELRRRFPDLNVSFREANVAISNEVAATFVELADQYPEVAARIKNIGDELGMRDLEPAASGYPMNGALGDAANGSDQAASPWIRINAKYSTEGFDDIARTGAESGFKPKGVFNLDRTLNDRTLSGVRSVMTHEFGHHVDYWLTDQFKKKYRLQGYEAELQRNALKDAGARAFGGPIKGLSEYASRNDRELFAEAFAEYQLSSSPRGLSRRIIEDAFISVGLPVPTAPATVIAKAYQRKYGSRSEAGRAAANARWGGRGAETGTAETAAVQIEPWVDQGSIKDINREFNKRWGERTILDLTGADIDAANGIADGLNELLTLYPDTELHFVGTEGVFKDAFSGRGVSLPSNLSQERKKELIELGQQFGVPPMGEGVAGSYITTVQGIRINAKLIAPGGEAIRFAVSSFVSEENNFYAKTGLTNEGTLSTSKKEAAKRTLVHEFGHAIDFTGSQAFGMKPVSKRNESSTDPVGRAMAGIVITPESRKKFVANYIGEYASTNSPELFAEVFTEYHLNPKPRKLSVDQAKYVMQRGNKTLAQPSMSNGIEKAYQRKYGSRTEAARAAANARWGNSATEDGSYRMSHQPSEVGPRAHNLTEDGGEGEYLTDDVYAHPERYSGAGATVVKETMAQLKQAKGNPDAIVTIHRWAPEGNAIESGNWVSLSKTYAEQHGESNSSGKAGSVISLEVPAKTIRFAGDDLAEFGYWPSSADAIAKAYKRKYATRAEAARAAANARWGNRAKTEDTGSDSGSVDRFMPSEKLLNAIAEAAIAQQSSIDFLKTAMGKELIAHYAEKVFSNEPDPIQSSQIAFQTLYTAHFLAETERSEYPENVIPNENKLQKILTTQPVIINITSEDFAAVGVDGRFKSQFETGDSMGLYDPKVRKKVEASLFGYNTTTTSPEKRPIYGSIDPDGPLNPASSTWRYGDVRVVLKDNVKDRTTFTPTDSLTGATVPSPIKNPGRHSISLNMDDPYAGYIETQIHGGVKMSDIAEIVIKDSRRLLSNSPAPRDTDAAKIGKTWDIPVRVIDLNGTVTTLGESA